jgi:hypothetical protein
MGEAVVADALDPEDVNRSMPLECWTLISAIAATTPSAERSFLNLV